jgi:hypothetical protein
MAIFSRAFAHRRAISLAIDLSVSPTSFAPVQGPYAKRSRTETKGNFCSPGNSPPVTAPAANGVALETMIFVNHNLMGR